MALVRCSCLLAWHGESTLDGALEVEVFDPECAYVVHRAESAVLGERAS